MIRQTSLVKYGNNWKVVNQLEMRMPNNVVFVIIILNLVPSHAFYAILIEINGNESIFYIKIQSRLHTCYILAIMKPLSDSQANQVVTQN